MSGLDLRTIARALGGEVTGRQVLAPGPNHSRNDRSLSVRLSAQSPTGFIVFSHAGDDFRDARDYVAAKLGLGPDAWKRQPSGQIGHTIQSRQCGDSASAADKLSFADASANLAGASDNAARIARARAVWDGAGSATGSLVETYLASRGLDLPDGVGVLRFHPHCPWRDEEAKRTVFVPAMVAALRQIQGDEITGIHRTRLTLEGAKVDRRMLGQASGAAVKLDADDEVSGGLHLAEGVETALAGRQLGFRPCWALGSAGGIKAFPVLSGIECLTLLAESDPTNAKAVTECGTRWHRAGREVTIVEPAIGSDLNDALRGVA